MVLTSPNRRRVRTWAANVAVVGGGEGVAARRVVELACVPPLGVRDVIKARG